MGYHNLITLPGPKRTTRRRCVLCYKKLSKERGSAYAAKNATQISTKCLGCNKFQCVPCFYEIHNYSYWGGLL